MTSPHANLRLGRPARGAGVHRDVTWGRILFVPPALVSPRLSFEPLADRAQFFAPAGARKTPAPR